MFMPERNLIIIRVFCCWIFYAQLLGQDPRPATAVIPPVRGAGDPPLRSPSASCSVSRA